MKNVVFVELYTLNESAQRISVRGHYVQSPEHLKKKRTSLAGIIERIWYPGRCSLGGLAVGRSDGNGMEEG